LRVLLLAEQALAARAREDWSKDTRRGVREDCQVERASIRSRLR
jgi:hypothetical protein